MKSFLTLSLALVTVGLTGCNSEPEPVAQTPPEEMGNTVTDPKVREQFRNGEGAAQGNSGQGLGSSAPGQ